MSLMDDYRLLVPPRPDPGGAAVTLAGAGPGDPKLLTVKALEALQRARVILYDHLVGPEILALARPDAERIYVGKEAARHALPQAQIIALMIRRAREGGPVLRLKGGDGYVFGRGGEEAAALAQAGIAFDVIPGITAAQGAAASAGIPLTHRDHAATLVFAAGHLRADRGEAGQVGADVDLDWAALARPRQTVVIYMGVGALPVIAERLIAHGLPSDTPAAVIERATLPDERCLTGPLHALPALALLHEVRPPALIVIGTVVSLRETLAGVASGAAGARGPVVSGWSG